MWLGPRVLGMDKSEDLDGLVKESLQQAARASDWTGFFWLGKMVEFAETAVLFTTPQEELTEAYISGRRG